MPHTLCPRGSVTNDRGEGPIEAFPTNQINLGSLFRMSFFSFVPGRASLAAGSLLQDILFLHQKCRFVVGGSFLEILRARDQVTRYCGISMHSSSTIIIDN